MFYACSDGTMKPAEFDIKKCLNFGFGDVKAVVVGDDQPTTSETSNVTEASDLTTTPTDSGDGLMPATQIDEDAADPNLAFLDYFNKGNQAMAGVGVVASASNAAECARICFNDETAMTNESEKCQGFVSDDSTYCKLYPSIDIGYGDVHSKHKAFRLKERKEGGGAISMFTTSSHSTPYGPDGGPVYYGNRHDLDCQGGGMTSFKWAKSGDQVNNIYKCLKSDTAFGGTFSKETGQNASGKEKGRNDMYYMDRHDVNCGNNFISQWMLHQWSRSMKVVYKCTNTQTPNPEECETLSVPDYPHHPHAGTWANKPVTCPANKVLTQWKYANGALGYRCCPKPK